MTADVSWKLMRPLPFVGLAIELNGHTPVYGAAPPTSVGACETSAGNFVQTKTSWTQRARRKARLPKYWAITPGFVSTPALGPLFVHSAEANVPLASVKVGQLSAPAVNMSM